MTKEELEKNPTHEEMFESADKVRESLRKSDKIIDYVREIFNQNETIIRLAKRFENKLDKLSTKL